MTRWDSPLFTILFDDENPPCEEIWNALIGTEGELKKAKPNQATVMVRKARKHGESMLKNGRNPQQNRITFMSSTKPHKTSLTKSSSGRKNILES